MEFPQIPDNFYKLIFLIGCIFIFFPFVKLYNTYEMINISNEAATVLLDSVEENLKVRNIREDDLLTSVKNLQKIVAASRTNDHYDTIELNRILAEIDKDRDERLKTAALQQAAIIKSNKYLHLRKDLWSLWMLVCACCILGLFMISFSFKKMAAIQKITDASLKLDLEIKKAELNLKEADLRLKEKEINRTI